MTDETTSGLLMLLRERGEGDGADFRSNGTSNRWTRDLDSH
jgi:hypothetical protein